PRRPVGHRARAGGSARPVPRREDPGPARQAPRRQDGAPTRQLPRTPGAGAGAPVRHRATAGRSAPEDQGGPPAGSFRAPSPTSRGPRSSRRRSGAPRPLRLAATLLALVLVVVVGWGAGLALWGDSRIEHVEALSAAQ